MLIVSLLVACPSLLRAQEAIDIFNNIASRVNENLENLPTSNENAKNVLGESIHPAEIHLIRALWAVDDILSSAKTLGVAGDVYGGEVSEAYLQDSNVLFVNMEGGAKSLADNLAAAKEELEKSSHSRGPALAALYEALLAFGTTNQISQGENSKAIIAEGALSSVTVPDAGESSATAEELKALVAVGNRFVTESRLSREALMSLQPEEVHELLYEKQQLRFKEGNFEGTIQKAAIKWLLSVLRLRTVIGYLEAAGENEGASQLKTQLKAAILWGGPFAVVDGTSQEERLFKLLPKWAESYCTN